MYKENIVVMVDISGVFVKFSKGGSATGGTGTGLSEATRYPIYAMDA